MGKQEIFDVTVKLFASTDKAVKVSDSGDEKRAVWLPKSQVEISKNNDGTWTVTGPEWLLSDKGLI